VIVQKKLGAWLAGSLNPVQRCSQPLLHHPPRSPAFVVAGGASLHACMTPHGPDTTTFEGATAPEAEEVAHLPRQAIAALA
jgi:hypothetical protein